MVWKIVENVNKKIKKVYVPQLRKLAGRIIVNEIIKETSMFDLRLVIPWWREQEFVRDSWAELDVQTKCMQVLATCKQFHTGPFFLHNWPY